MLMKLGVRHKLFGGFGLLIVVTAILGVVALLQIGSISSGTRDIATNALPSVGTVDDIAAAVEVYRQDQYHHVAASGAEQAQLAKDIPAKAHEIASSLAKYGRGYLNAGLDTELFDATKQQWAAYAAATTRFLALSSANRNDAALAVLNRGNAPFIQLRDTIAKWKAENAQSASASYASARSTYSSARLLTIVLVVLGAVTGMVVAFLIARGLVGGISQISRAAERIAEGDVEQQVDVRSRDELGDTARSFQRMLAYLKQMSTAADHIAAGDLTVEVQPVSDRDALGNAFSQMIGNLRRIVGDVSRAASTMGSASQQMASTSEEAGRAVGEIANAVADVASGAERQVQMVEEARTSTDETARAAEQARTVANEGVEAADKASTAMRELRDSNAQVTGAIRQLASKSEQIGGIVETITGIAGQTNLLALNAAIEAARAGEQGKGFAVVAEEVRKLAEESQTAAASISGLIAEIQQETETTVRAVEDGAVRTEESAATVEAARDSFQQIGASVEDMRSRIDRIVAATGEVAAVAQQSSASTEEVSASTEQTSASAQEIAASAQELARTADDLAGLVAQFKVTA
jgi:methyl-accepting chemotaxis protein